MTMPFSELTDLLNKRSKEQTKARRERFKDRVKKKQAWQKAKVQ